MFVLLDGGLQPLLAVLCEIWMSQEGHGERNVGFGRGQIPVVECFVDNVQCSSATWLFKIGGHTSDGINFEVCVASTAELLGCFEGGKRVFGEIAKEGEGMVLGRSKEVWFTEGLLSSAKLAKEAFVRGEAGVEVCSMFGELPAFCFELEVLGDERPVERWHPIGNVMMFTDPGLIVVVMGGELDWGEVMHIVMRMPVA